VFGTSTLNSVQSQFKYNLPTLPDNGNNSNNSNNNNDDDEDFKLFVATVYAEAGRITTAWEPIADTIMTRAQNLKQNVRKVITKPHQFSCYTNPNAVDWDHVKVIHVKGETDDPAKKKRELFWNEHGEFLKAWAHLHKDKTINNASPTIRRENDLIKQLKAKIKPYYDGQVKYKINFYYSPDTQKKMHYKHPERYKKLPDFLACLKNPEQYRVRVEDVPEGKFAFYYIPHGAK
jgi:hypothetical protein